MVMGGGGNASGAGVDSPGGVGGKSVGGMKMTVEGLLEGVERSGVWRQGGGE